MTYGQRHTLEVWGDYACFTRPEAKVERLSYPVITPSAARAIFDALYWSAQDDFFWQVHTVEVLKQLRYIALSRNEVKSKAPNAKTILAWSQGRAPIQPLLADEDRLKSGGQTLRQTVALKDVRYRITASMCSRTGRSALARDNQFRRRANQGVCRYQPYLGCREFPAYFEAVGSDLQPIDLDLDLGLMLYDVFDLRRKVTEPSVSLFHATLQGGVLNIPEFTSEKVLKS